MSVDTELCEGPQHLEINPILTPGLHREYSVPVEGAVRWKSISVLDRKVNLGIEAQPGTFQLVGLAVAGATLSRRRKCARSTDNR